MGDDLRPCSGFDAKSGRPCSRSVVRDVKAGCVHEHVGTHRLCLVHCDDLASGIMLCGRCLEAGHDCPLVPLNKADVHVPRRDWTRELLAGLGQVDEALLDLLAGEEADHA